MNENEKLQNVGHQALNIQAMEVEFKSCDSDGNPIDGTETVKILVYNLEKISDKEVEIKLKDGSYGLDPRILVTDPETASNIFPHMGEFRSGNVGTYWEPQHNYHKCSNCGFLVYGQGAVSPGTDGTPVLKYRYCPYCGSVMKIKEEKENG